MKVEQATIRLVLRSNKTLADGTNPIMLRVSFNGMKERATGYSCLPKFWNKREECLKKGYPNYLMVNQVLKKLKDEAIARRDKFIASDEVYTPTMILARETVRNAVTNDFYGLCDKYLEEMHFTSHNTLGGWNSARAAIRRFTDNKQLLVNEINVGFCKRFCKHLEDKGMSSSTIRIYNSKIYAIVRYATKLKLIDNNPLENWQYRKTYNDNKRDGYISGKTMDFMMQRFIDEIVVRKNDKTFSYRFDKIDELLNVKSDLYARYLYLVGYLLCGLAPVDISLLKKSDIKTVSVGGVDYYAIDGRRKKTGAPYKIRLLKNTIESAILINTMLIFNESDYFLPTLNGWSGNVLTWRLMKIYDRKKLIPYFKKINSEIAQWNVEHKDDQMNFIDLDLKFYSYRHSWIMNELQKPNANLLRIATMSGKAITSLHQYATLLDDINLV